MRISFRVHHNQYYTQTAVLFDKLLVCLLFMTLVLLIVVSCNDGSNPVTVSGKNNDCIDYEGFMHITGACDTPGSAIAVAVSGNYAFISDGRYSGLQVIDISSPTSPVIVGSIDTLSSNFGIAIYGDYAYVAAGSSGLQVVDITRPTSPVVVGSVKTPGYVSSVAVSGRYAYVMDYNSSLQVIDMIRPTAPTIGVTFPH